MSLGEHLRTKKALVNMILDMYVKWVTSTPFSVNVLSIGDVNRYDNVTITDVTMLVNIILGKSPK